MKRNNTILVVDEEILDIKIIKRIFSNDYEIIVADNEKKAFSIMVSRYNEIAAILYDFTMLKTDNYEFLKKYNENNFNKKVPVIVTSREDDENGEAECFRLGVWDYVRKPYREDILKYRLKNVIERCEYNYLCEIQYKEQLDPLTGIYRKEKFERETARMFSQRTKSEFVIIHFDIYKFQIFNALFGMREGDKLLKYIAQLLKSLARKMKHMTYCREDADIFNIGMEYKSEEELVEFFKIIRHELNLYKQDYNLIPVFGIYLVNDEDDITVRDMVDRAKLAAKECKGNYVHNYAFYKEEMSEAIFKEQSIVNSMKNALEEKQFVLYLQPKYELLNDSIGGAEVLVRWIDPEKGVIPPGEFIPIFERNGFIMELDYYIWEQTCKLLRKWIDKGWKPHAVSVNISRISLYNPNLVVLIRDLVDKYEIPPALLQFELTESAYTSNPEAIKLAMSKLQRMGFCILMDDFGSGYSSLNVLKDIAVDILKIDMKFMEKSEQPGRSENILASIIRMAKWLNLPVIAEGVENETQVMFLKSIGCEAVQGYYFSKPIPVEEYENMVFINRDNRFRDLRREMTLDAVWSSSPQMELLFSNMIQAVAVYEYDGIDCVEALKVNNSYYEMFGAKNSEDNVINILEYVDEKHRELVLDTFKLAAQKQDVAECEFIRHLPKGKSIWVEMKLKYICDVGNRYILMGNLSDITLQKKADLELQQYRTAVQKMAAESKTLLVVDDTEINRKIIKDIFGRKYKVLEAGNGQQALEVIKQENYDIDLILLDMMMPVMTGKEFMEYRKKHLELAHIPTVIITTDNSEQQQIECLQMGASDYIVKPFITEVVIKRVTNVLESSDRLSNILMTHEIK